MTDIDTIRTLQRIGGKMGAERKWAQTTDRTAATAAARQGWMDRFRRQVDPDGTLDPAERETRAMHAMRAHMAEMGLRSARARAARRPNEAARLAAEAAQAMREVAAELDELATATD